MSDILRLKRTQIVDFVGDDPDAVRVIERLIQNVNTLIVKVGELEETVQDLEARVAVLEGP